MAHWQKPLPNHWSFIFEITLELKKNLNWHTFHSVLKWHYIRKYMSLIRRFFSSGHLIQFRGDQAFQDLNVDLLGYFYNCQFPNVVYKAISCYKCRGSSGQHASLVCSLGQAVSMIKPCIYDIFMPPDRMIGGILFFVLSICFPPLNIKLSVAINTWHA